MNYQKQPQIDKRASLILSLSEQQKLMMASSDLPFVAESFGGGVQTTKYPIRPIPILVCFITMTLGIVISIITLVLVKYFKKNC